jgi:hypothetical protein
MAERGTVARWKVIGPWVLSDEPVDVEFTLSDGRILQLTMLRSAALGLGRALEDRAGRVAPIMRQPLG